MKFILLALFACACSTPVKEPGCKIRYPVLAGDSNYEIDATAISLGDAQALAYRVINNTCGAYYPSRTLKVLSETFAVDAKQSTVRIQFACVP